MHADRDILFDESDDGGEDDVERDGVLEGLAWGGRSGDVSGPALPPDTYFVDGDYGEHPDSGDDRLSSAGWALGSLSAEAPGHVAFDAVEELRRAAEAPLPISRGRRSVHALNITEEDFDPGAERNAFRILNGFGLRLFKPRSAGDIAQAIQFFFGVEPISIRHGDGRPAVDLELCCQVLRVRPAVLRLRIQYEFYLRDVMFTRPFGFAMAVLPTVISRELDFFPGALGKMMAGIAWLQPGITHAQLLRVAADRTQRDSGDAAFKREADKALEYMEGKYYMSAQHGWYTTGRNPFRMLRDWKLKYGRDWETVGGSMHWSRLFGRDD